MNNIRIDLMVTKHLKEQLDYITKANDKTKSKMIKDLINEAYIQQREKDLELEEYNNILI